MVCINLSEYWTTLLFCYSAWLEGNLLHCVRARAHECVLMRQKLCAKGICNVILRNHLKLKVPITPQNVFRFVKSLHGIRKNAANIFAID